MKTMYTFAIFAVLLAVALVNTISAEPSQAAEAGHVEETVVIFLNEFLAYFE
jgi:hypothetical protein